MITSANSTSSVSYTATLKDTFQSKDLPYNHVRVRGFLTVPFPHEGLKVTVDGVETDEWSYNTVTTIKLNHIFKAEELPASVMIEELE